MSEYERENKESIEAVELTDQEKIEAIQEAKIKKWFHLKNEAYWSKSNAKPIADIEPIKPPKEWI